MKTIFLTPKDSIVIEGHGVVVLNCDTVTKSMKMTVECQAKPDLPRPCYNDIAIAGILCGTIILLSFLLGKVLLRWQKVKYNFTKEMETQKYENEEKAKKEETQRKILEKNNDQELYEKKHKFDKEEAKLKTPHQQLGDFIDKIKDKYGNYDIDLLLQYMKILGMNVDNTVTQPIKNEGGL